MTRADRGPFVFVNAQLTWIITFTSVVVLDIDIGIGAGIGFSVVTVILRTLM